MTDVDGAIDVEMENIGLRFHNANRFAHASVRTERPCLLPHSGPRCRRLVYRRRRKRACRRSRRRKRGLRCVPGYLGAHCGRRQSGRIDELPGWTSRRPEHLSGFGYAFDGADRRQTLCPVRTVDDIAPPPRPHDRAALEPFFGASLEKWARRCAAAPNGVLYDRVGKRQMTEMRTSTRGEKVEQPSLDRFG